MLLLNNSAFCYSTVRELSIILKQVFLPKDSKDKSPVEGPINKQREGYVLGLRAESNVMSKWL